MESEVFVFGAIAAVLTIALLVLWRRLRRAERELAASEEWEQLCAQLDVGVGFCDENLHLRRANPAFFEMFVNRKLHAKRRAGRIPVDEWLGNVGAGHPLQEMLLRTLRGTESVSGHVSLDGSETCLVRAHRLNLNNGHLLLTVVASRVRNRAEAGDLTMVAGSAAVRTRDERRGERRKRERLKDSVIIRITHDLRNTLNAAMGWLHLIETEKVPREEIGGAVRRIHNSVLRQNTLIDELRKLAEPVSPAPAKSGSDHSLAR